jgi:Sec-independent protein secretion pathway component TatC
MDKILEIVVFLAGVAGLIVSARNWYLIGHKHEDRYLVCAIAIFVMGASFAYLQIFPAAILAAVMILLLAAHKWLSQQLQGREE